MSIVRNSRFSLLMFLLAVAGLTACKKNDTNIGRTPAAGLMAFNLTVDKAVGISLSGNQFGNSGLGYTDYTGQYLPIFIGNREVRSFDYFTGSTLAISNQEFKDSMYYSVFVLGDSGFHRNVVTTDDYSNVTPVTGKAWIRYVNAIPDSTASASVTVGEMNETAQFGKVSAFEQVDAGSLDIAINDGSDIQANRTITVEQDKIYTVLFVGKPNHSDTAKTVKIKYIVNGVATQ